MMILSEGHKVLGIEASVRELGYQKLVCTSEEASVLFRFIYILLSQRKLDMRSLHYDLAI